MTADPTLNATPVPRKPQPGEQFFEQSISDLARRLGERTGGRPADLQAAAEARRLAMQAYERERARKFRLILGGVGAVTATVCLAWVVVLLGQPEAADGPTAVASTLSIPASTAPAPTAPPPASVAMASTLPAPEPPPQITPAVDIQPPPAATEPQPDPRSAATMPGEPPRAQPALPLGRDEIREVQKRLRGFGFNPGPVDGVAGRQTEIATQRYLEARGQPQLVPTDRDFLVQLRQDPAPSAVQTQVAQRPVQSDGRGKSSSQQQPGQSQRSSFDPFAPVKIAGTEITRWLSSVFR